MWNTNQQMLQHLSRYTRWITVQLLTWSNRLLKFLEFSICWLIPRVALCCIKELTSSYTVLILACPLPSKFISHSLIITSLISLDLAVRLKSKLLNGLFLMTVQDLESTRPSIEKLLKELGFRSIILLSVQGVKTVPSVMRSQTMEIFISTVMSQTRLNFTSLLQLHFLLMASLVFIKIDL